MCSSILARIPGFWQQIIPEPHVPSRGYQARGTRLTDWWLYHKKPRFHLPAPACDFSGKRGQIEPPWMVLICFGSEIYCDKKFSSSRFCSFGLKYVLCFLIRCSVWFYIYTSSETLGGVRGFVCIEVCIPPTRPSWRQVNHMYSS
jgi:hypothetical protein